MTKKDLKKMSRIQLLELLITQIERNQILEEELKNAREQLENRKIILNNAGSIAEAALQLHGIFEAAEAAAQQYLENVRELSGISDRIRSDKEDGQNESEK